MNPQLAINILKFYGKIKNVGFYLLPVPRIEASHCPVLLNEQRQISCNIQNDKKLCVNANIHSI